MAVTYWAGNVGKCFRSGNKQLGIPRSATCTEGFAGLEGWVVVNGSYDVVGKQKSMRVDLFVANATAVGARSNGRDLRTSVTERNPEGPGQRANLEAPHRYGSPLESRVQLPTSPRHSTCYSSLARVEELTST